MKKEKILPCFIYLYLSLPILVLMLGWMKIYLAVPLALAVVWCCCRAVRGESTFWMPQWNRDMVRRAVFIVLILALWVYFAGIGGLAWQNPDHYYRNEIFHILVDKPWPVRVSEEGVARALTYYIGFWMPAAAFGKVFGLSAGFLFQAFWAVLGLGLVYSCICDHLRRFEKWPLAVFIFFSGLDVIGDILWKRSASDIFSTYHLEWWSADFWEYSAFTTDLFWVFNQAIYAWLILLLLMRQKDNKRVVLIWSFGLFTCSLPFVGMIPYVIWLVFRNFRDQRVSVTANKGKTGRKAGTNFWQKTALAWIRGLFTLENVLGGGIVGLLSYSYIRTSSTSQNSLLFLPGKISLMNYVLFCILEFGVYAIAVYRYRKNQKLYWMTIVILFLCAFIRVGTGPDFSMRASIPALTVLYLMVVDALAESSRKKEWKVFIPLVLLLCIGAVTPIHEMARTVEGNAQYYEQNQAMTKIFVQESQVMQSHNFSSSADENFFYKYLAR